MPRITEEAVRSLVKAEYRAAGWLRRGNILTAPPTFGKDDIRAATRSHRKTRALREQDLVDSQGRDLLIHFASGQDIRPERFDPELVMVQRDTIESDLFRMATLFWSIPVSRGYGRRMRYLIIDRYNDKVVGILALGDPVFNLGARDSHIAWDHADRAQRLYHVMDAYVLGAVPPYNQLLGGKFIALCAISDQIRADFSKKYKRHTTVIDGQRKASSLVLVTTTSALGRSSVYNRIRLPNENSLAYHSVGFSRGYGHFHISDDTFAAMRRWLRQKNDPYADGHEYGCGPNWRLRTIRRALDLLGFQGNVMKHGIQREVFMAPLAHNYAEFLRGEHKAPRYYKRPIKAIVEHYRERWMIPRSIRSDEWTNWRS